MGKKLSFSKFYFIFFLLSTDRLYKKGPWKICHPGNQPTMSLAFRDGLDELYRMSYMWYGAFAVCSCLIIGILVTLLTCCKYTLLAPTCLYITDFDFLDNFGAISYVLNVLRKFMSSLPPGGGHSSNFYARVCVTRLFDHRLF